MRKIIFLAIFLTSLPALAANMVEQFQQAQQIVFTASTTSALALGVNQNRGYLMVQNSCASTDNITVQLRVKETASTGIQLPPCSSYEFDKIPTNSVWIKSASGSQTAIILEGNIAYGESQ